LVRHIDVQPNPPDALNQRTEKKQFESLLVPILDFLLGLAMQLTRNRPHAEDLVQDAVLKAYRSFSSFEPGSNFRAWVARILTNTFLTAQERARRFVHGVDIDEMPDSAAADHTPPEGEESVRSLEDIPRDALGDEVMAALRELPAGMAIAVYLADVDKLPYTEIGEILDIPIGTVRSRVSRGRRHLQKRLLSHARQLRYATGKGS
jgi:RNA polymerase sigma-70 factor (ECF subfamily)